jgi:hypothetical protein
MSWALVLLEAKNAWKFAQNLDKFDIKLRFLSVETN